MINLIEKLKNALEKMFLWPPFGGITTVSGLVAGYLGAHFDKEIASSFFVPWFLDGHIFIAGPTLFWILAILFGTFFTGTFWSQARSSARLSEKMVLTTAQIDSKTDSLTERAMELNDRVRKLHTLPPVGFLENYREIITSSEAAYETVRAGNSVSDADALALAIRTQLLMILNIVKAFDADGAKAKYGVNIMLYYESKSLNASESAALGKRILFIEKGVSINNLAGVLDMICELSVSSISSYEPDNSLSPFALPIPVLDEVERRARLENGVLPGAPDAFTSRSESVIETLSDWTDRASVDHYSATLRSQLLNYFKDKNWMQSFVSVPIFEPENHDAATNTPIAVLNIHRNLENKLAAEKYELLSPLLVPVTLPIGRLLMKYKDSLEISGQN